MPHVSNNDVISIVHSLKNSSPGWDDLPAFVAKKMCQWIYHTFDKDY